MKTDKLKITTTNISKPEETKRKTDEDAVDNYLLSPPKTPPNTPASTSPMRPALSDRRLLSLPKSPQTPSTSTSPSVTMAERPAPLATSPSQSIAQRRPTPIHPSDNPPCFFQKPPAQQEKEISLSSPSLSVSTR